MLEFKKASAEFYRDIIMYLCMCVCVWGGGGGGTAARFRKELDKKIISNVETCLFKLWSIRVIKLAILRTLLFVLCYNVRRLGPEIDPSQI